MATRRPQRTRRRTAPAAPLPRPMSGDAAEAGTGITRSPLRPSRHRAHHVTTDYHYVRRDLLTIVVVGGLCSAFIVVMALVVGAI